MLNHRNNLIALAILLPLALMAWYLGYCNAFVPILVLFLFTSIAAWGSIKINSNYHIKAICKGDVAKNEIALSFDDGPDPLVTPQILDLLKAYNATASFFCIGKKVQMHNDLVKRIDAEGHIVGNHSFKHGNWFNMQNGSSIKKELELTQAAIFSSINKKPKYFRPPYGVTNPVLKKALKNTEFTVIGWSLRSMDTVRKDPNKLIKKVTSQLKWGDIVLFHDTQVGTVLALEAVLNYCKANDIKIVALDKLTNTQAYE